jgi:5-methylcytosine-specific restriction enzyme A
MSGAADKRRRRDVVFKRDGYRCVRCGAGNELTLDHIIPRASGGSNKITNLQTLCWDCNQQKADRRERRYG